MNETYLIDTHSHVDMIAGLSTEDVLENAYANGVRKIIVPCAYPKDVDKIYELVNKYDNLYGLLGVHPSEARDWDDSLIEKIKKYASSPKIVGIGEIGLDYYWDKSFNDVQKEVFIKQIKLANELGLPVCVHDREAHKDSFDILKKYNEGSPVVMHCFSGSVEFARECIKEGWYLALGGVVTFKNAVKMKEVAEDIPLDKLLLETDAPYLTPVPFRGKENRPAYVRFVAEEIAKIRGVSFNEIAQATSENAEKVFNLEKS
ncbi:TPA: TatD family hydrolase [Candidatus Scatousia excrementigallinarum]|uniref:TatD family hydrolase n=1 Tax=Candidatus Scatousia excrementigallinarum TaxID=2840935 RepID=A0A9D1EZU4_9BACT|nr:TatD family hydrolase [Candidatus Scatousia excrementigallinarum]